MKFIDHLNKDQIQGFNQLRRSIKNEKEPKTKPKQSMPNKEEKLSKKDWEEIMGKHRDTYHRVGGAVKRR